MDKRATRRRMVIMLVIVGVVLGGLVGFNFFKGYMMQKYMASAPIPASTVTAMTAGYQQWQPQLSAVGPPRPGAWNLLCACVASRAPGAAVPTRCCSFPSSRPRRGSAATNPSAAGS